MSGVGTAGASGAVAELVGGGLGSEDAEASVEDTRGAPASNGERGIVSRASLGRMETNTFAIIKLRSGG
eukprot:3940285-Pleurochrysis_carterae.AAC.2